MVFDNGHNYGFIHNILSSMNLSYILSNKILMAKFYFNHILIEVVSKGSFNSILKYKNIKYSYNWMELIIITTFQ
jgi:hypothetical protein